MSELFSGKGLAVRGSQGSVTRLIIDLRSDEPAVREVAARLVWGRYFKELLVLARNHLSARIRCREDEEDVLQSMYKSFYVRQRRGDFDLANRDELWSLLVQITLRKARNTATRHLQGKRDVRREDAGAVADRSGGEPPGTVLDRIDSDGPTPAEAALLNEALQRRFLMLNDPDLRQIALWKLEGYTNQEIAGRLDCTLRTVERKLERIRAYWERGDD
jgi:RNA polymerase sigma-70 factor (ECF subfamily)